MNKLIARLTSLVAPKQDTSHLFPNHDAIVRTLARTRAYTYVTHSDELTERIYNEGRSLTRKDIRRVTYDNLDSMFTFIEIS